MEPHGVGAALNLAAEVMAMKAFSSEVLAVNGRV